MNNEHDFFAFQRRIFHDRMVTAAFGVVGHIFMIDYFIYKGWL